MTLSGKLDDATLLTKLGAAYCLDNYSTMDPKTRKRVFASDVLADEIRLRCDAFGLAQAETVRGPGLYVDDGKLVIHYGLSVYDESGTPVDTTPSTERVYVAGAGLGFTASTPCASVADVHLVESAFESFGFKQPHGAAVSMGWLASAAMGAVLPHSPSLIVTAAKGSGKSTWATLQKALLGTQAELRDGIPTVAQVLHAVKDSSLTMLLDEFEPTKVSKREMLKLAEVFNSGFTKTPGKGIDMPEPLASRRRPRCTAGALALANAWSSRLARLGMQRWVYRSSIRVSRCPLNACRSTVSGNPAAFFQTVVHARRMLLISTA